jgi:DNA polymerase-3 subunit beta
MRQANTAKVAIPETDADGTVLVPGRMLVDIVTSLNGDKVTVTLSEDASKVIVKGGKAKFTLPVIPEGNYPTLPVPPAVSGTVNAAAFSHGSGQVAAAAATEAVNPVLTGVRIEASGNELTLVATDRYRLAVRSLAWTPGEKATDTAVIVPASVFKDALRALAKHGEDISVSFSDSLVAFAAGGYSTTIGLIDGDYPKWRALLESDGAKHVTVTTSDLADALKRADLVRDKASPVRISLAADSIRVQVTGDATVDEAVEATYDGEEMDLGFNPTYLREGLLAAGSDEVTVAVVSPVKSAVLTAADDKESFKYLIMPMRL